MARSAVFPALRFRLEFGITPGLSATLTLPDYGRLARQIGIGAAVGRRGFRGGEHFANY